MQFFDSREKRHVFAHPQNSSPQKSALMTLDVYLSQWYFTDRSVGVFPVLLIHSNAAAINVLLIRNYPVRWGRFRAVAVECETFASSSFSEENSYSFLALSSMCSG